MLVNAILAHVAILVNTVSSKNKQNIAMLVNAVLTHEAIPVNAVSFDMQPALASCMQRHTRWTAPQTLCSAYA